MAKSKIQKKDDASANGHLPADELRETPVSSASSISSLSPAPKDNGDEKLSPFLRKQKLKLLHLRDTLLDSMMGVSRDTLRARAEGSEASAFGMHQADAGSQAFRAVAGVGHDHLVPVAPQNPRQRVPHEILIVDNQDLHRFDPSAWEEFSERRCFIIDPMAAA